MIINYLESMNILHRITYDYLGVDYDATLKKNRFRKYVEARYITVYIFYDYNKVNKLDVSLADLGKFFVNPFNQNGFNHATMIHAIKETGKLYESNSFLENGSRTRTAVDEIYEKFLIKMKFNPEGPFSTTNINKRSMIWSLIGR